ncbi:MAG: hypothetical protein ACI9PP_002082 [Halobacteriales archaeon]|jgi:hypothetical protein
MEESAADGGEDDSYRVWMVERRYSSDSPNILVIIYATPDGTYYLQKEWAFNRFGSGPAPEVTAAIEGEQEALNPVENLERREQYAMEADRMQERHDPDDPV